MCFVWGELIILLDPFQFASSGSSQGLASKLLTYFWATYHRELLLPVQPDGHPFFFLFLASLNALNSNSIHRLSSFLLPDFGTNETKGLFLFFFTLSVIRAILVVCVVVIRPTSVPQAKQRTSSRRGRRSKKRNEFENALSTTVVSTTQNDDSKLL